MSYMIRWRSLEGIWERFANHQNADPFRRLPALSSFELSSDDVRDLLALAEAANQVHGYWLAHGHDCAEEMADEYAPWSLVCKALAKINGRPPGAEADGGQ